MCIYIIIITFIIIVTILTMITIINIIIITIIIIIVIIIIIIDSYSMLCCSADEEALKQRPVNATLYLIRSDSDCVEINLSGSLKDSSNTPWGGFLHMYVYIYIYTYDVYIYIYIL